MSRGQLAQSSISACRRLRTLTASRLEPRPPDVGTAAWYDRQAYALSSVVSEAHLHSKCRHSRLGTLAASMTSYEIVGLCRGAGEAGLVE